MQFFASKKRKSLSPCLKPGKSEKDVKNIVQGSPSAKCTLDNYLVTSQGDNNLDKLSCAARDALAPQDSVKRNLSLEINSFIKDDFKMPFSSSHSQAAEVLKPNEKESSRELTEVVGVAVDGYGKGNTNLVQGAENSKLQKFATDFLSLYCRYCTLNSSTIKCKCFFFLVLFVGFFWGVCVLFFFVGSLAYQYFCLLSIYYYFR